MELSDESVVWVVWVYSGRVRLDSLAEGTREERQGRSSAFCQRLSVGTVSGSVGSQRSAQMLL